VSEGGGEGFLKVFGKHCQRSLDRSPEVLTPSMIVTLQGAWAKLGSRCTFSPPVLVDTCLAIFRKEIVGRLLFHRLLCGDASDGRRLFGALDVTAHARLFAEGIDRTLLALAVGEEVLDIPLLHHLAKVHSAAGLTEQDYQQVC